MVLNNQCIAKPDLITYQRHCVVMQSVLASSLHVYLVFPQHPFVCSPHAQDSCLYVMCIRPLHMRLLPSSAYLQQQKIKLPYYFLHSAFRCRLSIILQCISFCLIIHDSTVRFFLWSPGKTFQLMLLNNAWFQYEHSLSKDSYIYFSHFMNSQDYYLLLSCFLIAFLYPQI